MYTGGFHYGLKQGWGHWKKDPKDANSNEYEGEYYQDRKQGNGKFSWDTGNVYNGQYRNDEREGIGEMKWTDGSVYIGEWL